jgi:O-antigen ligase
VNKSRFASTLRQHRSGIALITALGMVAGFMCGRAILSLSMFLFGLNAIWDIHPRQWLKQRWWVLGLAWIGVYAISGFWSTDTGYLSERLQVKLPFMLLPLGFALLPALSFRQTRWFTWGMCLLLFCGSLYSLSFAIRDPEAIFNGYFTSKVMPTPAYKDHIRFSILIAWFILWCYYMFPRLGQRWQKTVVALAIVYFTLFLHLLAVRSGLLFFYLFTISYIVYLFLQGRRLLSGSIMLCFVTTILLAYRYIPSFHYKMGYIKYTFEEYYDRGNMSGDFSDMGRILSYQAAWNAFSRHPVAGVGAGDILVEMEQQYRSVAPGIKPEQILIPHNQVMVVAVATGLLGLVPFLCWLCYPLLRLRRTRDGYFVLATWVCLLFSLFTEPMLEVQFGVFVFLFCLLWMMHSAKVSGQYQGSGE